MIRCPMPSHAPERENLTVAEIALDLGVSVWTVRRKIASGELPAVHTGGKGSAVRVNRREYERWLFAEPPTERPE
jgi:excisionase family DNA binding protein